MSRSTEPLPMLPIRAVDCHKGTFGRALLIGGCRGMSGAIALAGMATLRSGAGLVQLATTAECLQIVAACEPSYMTAALPADRSGRISVAAMSEILRLAVPATAIACGPGLGRSGGLSFLVARLFHELPCPMIVDADALHGLVDAGAFATLDNEPRQARMPTPHEPRQARMPTPRAPRILTPHPGEFARMLGVSTADVQSRRQELAAQFATRHDVVLVLKGHRTIITDGRRTAVNETGNPGMATGGSGDVLTGVITALVCQGLAPFDAARLGAHVHGLAGDLAAAELALPGGARTARPTLQLQRASLIAADIVRFLPASFAHATK